MSVPPAAMLDLQIILGRVNALHAFCIALACSLPKATLAIAAGEMRVGNEKIAADALATPIPEATLIEMLRVTQELQQVLHANSLPPDRDPSRPGQ